uniref:Uncharacterized protein n=1 Tax=Cajanus cajan TaxID=3821 RepID=A0A151U9R0_CAJCA|nr:hypothetical protein KK1_020255 [Cajanus cajan]
MPVVKIIVILVNDFESKSYARKYIKYIISKVLTNTLHGIFSLIILENQYVFILGRHMLNIVLVVVKAIDYAQKYKKPIFVMKIDYEKAYDSVKWDYLLGDSLAPSLFLIDVEGLRLLMTRALDMNLFMRLHLGGEGSMISLLQFVDDTLIIREATRQNLWSAFLHCKVGQLPFKHLGIPLGANPRKLSTWKPILDGLLIKEIVVIQRDFLWRAVKDGSKIPWVRWEMVYKFKVEGGLGIKDVRLFNWARLGKWVWRCMLSPGMLWAKVLHGRYGRIESFSNCSNVDKRASWW